MRSTTPFSFALLAVVLMSERVGAQNTRSSPALDVSAGWAGFADESIIHHRAVSGSPRFYVTPRLSGGPEVTYMAGPGTDRDLFVLGNLTYEWPLLLRDGVPRVVPFVVGGWGYMRHRSRFGSFIAHGSAYAGGTGVRVRLSDRLFVGSELRFGSELHARVNGAVTVRFGP
jgi:hypothetical protein